MFNIPQIEQKILKFWQEKKIFQKSLEKDSPQGDYVFYDGPPFATGTPHYGHIVASLMKDIVPRYWTMRGYYVERKWGWDCHGLPIENIVEEEMGLESKKDIEEIGIDKFNETCRSKVLMYAQEWRKVVERMGRWIDMEQCYKTMDKNYMESVWWVFKELWDKGLIYQGYRSMHICPRCETTLSQSEVGQGYKDIEDISVIVKFRIKNYARPASRSEAGELRIKGIKGNVYILAWTTTPWTLFGNVALAVGTDIKYSLVENKKTKDKYLLAKDLLQTTFGDNWTRSFTPIKIGAKDDIFGRDLEGLKYEPLFDYYLGEGASANGLENKQNLYTIQTANFVSTKDGTGVVHIAPAFGEDDMSLGKEKKLPFIQHVQKDGRLKSEVGWFAGLEVKPKDNPLKTDRKVLDELIKKDLIFKEFKYTHSYPHCWRCDSPLLNYATSSWFVAVKKIKDKALECAKKINWVPEHLKQGRFGAWLEGARDWSISRQRFWGSVIPIWQCTKTQKTHESQEAQKVQGGCGELKVIGSVKELEKLSGEKIDDLHKHFVDNITFECEKCGGVMRRIPDVLDCWFESGSMPYAQVHYPFENKEKFEANFPAEFIAEGVDQTRCWFYYLHILSTALKNSHTFQNVAVNGMVLAEDGKKMSKHLSNYPDPMDVFDKYGADAVRYYLATSSVMKADDLCFAEKGVDEVYKKVLLILYNVISFYKIFENNIDNTNKYLNNNNINNILDKWILAKVEFLKNEVTKAYDDYDLIKASRPIEGFINELSTWYIRRSRGRFKDGHKEDKKAAIVTLNYVLIQLAQIIAPVMPFTADYMYQELNGSKESVHLDAWPEVNESLINQKVLDYMVQTRKVVELSLAKRAKVGIKVRQPLSTLHITHYTLPNEYLELIKDEVNVKNLIFEKGEGNLSVEIDTEITDELKQEGMFRELVHKINDLRKQNSLTRNDKVVIEYNAQDGFILKVFEKYRDELIQQTVASQLLEVDSELEKVKVNEIWFGLKIEKR